MQPLAYKHRCSPGAGTLTPFGKGSVSLRIYPHTGLDAVAVVEEMRAQSRLAALHGFDGVMTAEHHAGFAGYIPNPLQAAGWLLEAMQRGWAAPCPLLLPLRPATLVAEEAAWLAARFPGRVGLGVAAGALEEDFRIAGTSREDLTGRFASGLALLADILGGSDSHGLGDDPAVGRCAEHPVPLVSASASATAARRAAALGAGILLDSLTGAERCRQLTDTYRRSGGSGSVVLVRRTWVGEPPRSRFERQVEVYRSFAPASSQTGWEQDQMIAEREGDLVTQRLADVAARTGADCLNLRVHVPGIAPGEVREQIVKLGEEVLPRLRRGSSSGTDE